MKGASNIWLGVWDVDTSFEARAKTLKKLSWPKPIAKDI